MRLLFLHGLDSSSQGTKGRFFSENFPNIIAPDFQGDLHNRLQDLQTLCAEWSELIMIGSSFGGLMATCYAQKHPEKIKKLILLAPALNFPEFCAPENPLLAPTFLLIGKNDSVTPPDIVIPRAKETFDNLTIEIVDDDHMLHTSFFNIDWKQFLA